MTPIPASGPVRRIVDCSKPSPNLTILGCLSNSDSAITEDP
jgi:hypothetical protein